MFPRQEVTFDIKWKPDDFEKAVEEGTWSKDGTPIGTLSRLSPPLKKILAKSFSSDKNDTYDRSIGNTLMAALEREYPEIVSASFSLSGSVFVRRSTEE